MEKKRNKSMSDGEVNDFAFKKLIGDLGGLEAENLFKEDAPAPSGGGGSLKIEITHQMDGQQTKAKPVIEREPDAEDEPEKKAFKLGK